MKQLRVRGFKSIILCVLSAILSALPFCNGKLWIFAWIGFVPLFFALQNKSRLKVFLLSYITGVIFWSITIHWLIHVTLLGQILLILYLALYFGIFGLFVPHPSSVAPRLSLLYIPSLWVLLEYLRSHLLSGFGWALLGYSQYLNLPVIQIADLFGAYGVSFLMMMVNVSVWQFIRGGGIETMVPVILFIVSLAYGFLKLYYLPPFVHRPSSFVLKISLIQGNIPQELKWAPGSKPFILDRYIQLTNAAARTMPDLIIWPEASNPGFLGEGEDEWISQAIFKASRNAKIPLLFGSAVREKEKYFNSAVLTDPEGTIAARYDKLHLVPFGEYIPLKNFFPFLETIVPIGDFTPGQVYTLCKLPVIRYPLPVTFAVLICFEDTIPKLSRAFVKKGADFLVNITNDAWFGRTTAAYQHLSASVFRAVENRVSLVRSANTGVSCFIDSYGRITAKVCENGKDIFAAGVKTGTITLGKSSALYSAIGDMFVLGCLAIAAVCGIIAKLRQPTKTNSEK